MASSLLYRRAIPASATIVDWPAPDGWPLRRFDWPATGAARGSILFQGGRGDIVEKYLELFAHWHAQGWSVTWFDWRGQSGSGRLTPSATVGHIEDFGSYANDYAAFYAEWAARTPGPHVVMGHSMGGHLVLRCLVEAALKPAAAVLVAPMLGLKTAFGARLGEGVAGLMGSLGSSARPAWKDNEKPGAIATRQALLTHDPDRYQDEMFWQSAKPELTTGPPSWRWVIAAFRSTRRLRTDPRLGSMTVPVLMLLPMADQLVDAKAALGVAAKLPDVGVFQFGDEAAHEVLREVDAVRDRAIGAIDGFLATRAAAVK